MRTCSPCGGWAGFLRCCSRSPWCRRSRARPPGLHPKASRSSSTASRRSGAAASGSSATPPSIPTAQCGTVSVPVDYAKPEGAQAQLAVIRIPATGDRIGVLVVNPGGPGASAVDTVASMGASLADTDITRRFDLVGIDPRGVGHSTPELRCRTDAEFDAYRREPMADYSPDGVAHIEALYSQFAGACAQKMGTGVPRQRRDRVVCARHGRRARRARREPDQLSRLLLRDRARCGLRRAVPRSGAGDGSRRSGRPRARSDRRQHPPDGGLPNGFQRLRGRLRDSPPAARSAPIRRSSSTAFTSWSTRWWPIRPRRPIRVA